jgi:Mor family transcriptional regulator
MSYSSHAKRRQELLENLAEHVALRLVEKHALSPETAADIGNDLADWASDHYGGQYIYFGKGQTNEFSVRDLEIYNSLERGNANELAAKHGVSAVRIYQIAARVREQLRQQNEPQLPGMEIERSTEA